MNDHSAGYTELPRTAYLDHTLRRARTAAEQRSHRYVTLEHFLLALLDDPDALSLLRIVGADVAVIQTAAADAVNNRMSTLVDPTGRPPSFSYKFDSLFPGASENAMRAGRREVCGALALIAVANDPDSNASAILAANGFNSQAGLQALGSAPSAQTSHCSRRPRSRLPCPLRFVLKWLRRQGPSRRCAHLIQPPRPIPPQSRLPRTRAPVKTSWKTCWQASAIFSMQKSARNADFRS